MKRLFADAWYYGVHTGGYFFERSGLFRGLVCRSCLLGRRCGGFLRLEERHCGLHGL